MENPSSTILREAILEIRDTESCVASGSGEFTGTMMCAEAPCMCEGPGNVRYLL